MIESKLIKLCQELSKKEMTRFREFAQSPFFNKHDGVQKLAGFLHAVYPQFDERKCRRELVYQQLFPGEAHDQAKLALIFTYTQRLLDEFLMQEQFAEETRLQRLLLLRRLRQRKWYDRYEKVMANALEEVQRNPSRGAADLWYEAELAGEGDAYYAQTSTPHMAHHLYQKQVLLDRYYLAEKLRDACEMAVRRNIQKSDYAARLLEAALQEVGAHPESYESAPLVMIYYRMYLMLLQPSHAHYDEALLTFERSLSQLPGEELKTIFNYFQNYCIRQINQGDERFLQEIFRLYRAQLEQDLLIEDGFLSEWHYKNIVTTALRLREVDWVKTFIEQYAGRLSPEARANAYRFNLASYHYAVGQYDKVLELLVHVEYSDLRYNLGAKALLLRTYYDLEEFEALHALAVSFRHYLQRRKLMADFRKQGYYNLFRFTRRAAFIKAGRPFRPAGDTQRNLSKLQQDIAAADAIFNKAWLVEKVGELWE
jgi:hypothetical protein